jgi:PhnB protein
MSVKTTTHTNFHDEARTALEFYQSVFGRKTAIATYADIHAAENDSHANEVA